MNKNELIDKLKSKKQAPFLFLGSGFSRHYIDTPDWEGVLSLFAPKHINQYYSLLDTDSLPKIASGIAKDVTKLFWDLPDDNDFKSHHIEEIKDQSTVLKIKISEFLREKAGKEFPEKYKEEIQLLNKLCIDGIITTNWDDTAERMFPTFKSYIGQQELIFSSTFNIGEIYKIHGCVTQPNSLILTEDYNDFNEKNAYLAAKLITIFIEHPIIFMGYSISDKNIIDLLKSIVGCMDKKNIEKLRDNLIFVEWNADENTTLRIEPHSITLKNDVVLPVTRIETHNYIDVYECLSYYERTIPTNLLREYKKQFYEIVVSEKPEKQLYVLPESSIDGNKQIQVVYGFGAVSKFKSATGYAGLTAQDLFRDILDDQEFNSVHVLTKSIPYIRKTAPNAFLPCYKYLSDIGIKSIEDFQRNQLGINMELRSLKDFQNYPSFSIEDKHLTLEEAISKYQGENVWKAIALIPYLQINEEDLNTLKDFIKEYFNEFLIKKNSHSTQMRKLVCFYDWFKYGWH